MKLITFTGIASLLALSACASHNAVAPPSGLGRAPVNTSDAIAAYGALAPFVAPVANDTRLERRVDDLSRQVGELKAYLVMLQMAKAQPTAMAAKSTKQASFTSTKAQAAAAAPSLSMSIGHEVGVSRFILDPDEAETFVAAAKASGQITIRGRSDGNRFTPKAKALAIDRAVRVKAYLISHGVPAEAIRITYCTHGCQLGDGATTEGRRLNRQTRIELSGRPPAQRSAMGTKE